MEFLSHEQFIGDMPEEYGATIKSIRKAITNSEKRLCSDDPEAAAAAKHDLPILRDMLDDMTRAKRTVEGYYEPGGDWDDRYTVRGRIKAKKRSHPSYEAYLMGGDNSAYIRRLKRELRECIKHRLTEKQRKALLLCEYQGLTQEQAAAQLGVGQPRIHKRLAAAQKKIAKKLLVCAQNRG